MGAYRSKPLTEKESEAGVFCFGDRQIIYGATAMQGWRMSMEDAHSIIPHFDEGSSFFGVYDGHGGREVAVYCATHLADLIKSAEAYSQGNVGQAMKDAFMKCDRVLKEKEAIEEMKKYDEDEISEEEHDQDSREDLENLLEESSMPLHDLLARYNAPMPSDTAEVESKSGDFQRIGTSSSILQLLTDSDSESDEEVEISSDELDSSDDNESSEVISSESSTARNDSETKIVANFKQVDKTNLDSTAAEKLSVQPPTPNIHDPLQAETDTEKLHNSDHDYTKATIEVSKKVPKFEPKSLMDLLTSKPSADNPMLDIKSVLSSRKRLRHYDDSDCDGETQSKARAMDKQGYHSGTTAVVGVLREKDFIVANAGDSKCVLASKGRAIDMSFDHKPTDQVELDRITNAGGRVGPDKRVNGGLNLSRALGDHFYKSNLSLPLENQMITAMPDIQSVPISNDQEFIVFACDGIWNSKSSQEVVDFVCCRLKEKAGNGVPTQQDLSLICESLCDACLAADTDNDGTGCDNMTCILIILQSLHKKSATS